jgi:hypothetical protein
MSHVQIRRKTQNISAFTSRSQVLYILHVESAVFPIESDEEKEKARPGFEPGLPQFMKGGLTAELPGR